MKNIQILIALFRGYVFNNPFVVVRGYRSSLCHGVYTFADVKSAISEGTKVHSFGANFVVFIQKRDC